MKKIKTKTETKKVEEEKDEDKNKEKKEDKEVEDEDEEDKEADEEENEEEEEGGADDNEEDETDDEEEESDDEEEEEDDEEEESDDEEEEEDDEEEEEEEESDDEEEEEDDEEEETNDEVEEEDKEVEEEGGTDEDCNVGSLPGDKGYKGKGKLGCCSFHKGKCGARIGDDGTCFCHQHELYCTKDCGGKWVKKQFTGDEIYCSRGTYEAKPAGKNHGDVCRLEEGWECPIGCQMTDEEVSPYCLLSGTQQECHKSTTVDKGGTTDGCDVGSLPGDKGYKGKGKLGCCSFNKGKCGARIGDDGTCFCHQHELYCTKDCGGKWVKKQFTEEEEEENEVEQRIEYEFF